MVKKKTFMTFSYVERTSHYCRQRHFPTRSAPSPIHLLTSVPLPQAEAIGIHIGHGPRLTAIPRDTESQHNSRLADELVQIEQPGLAIHGQFKRADQTPRRGPDAVPGGSAGGLNGRVDAKHVDLTLALVHEHVGRVEVELEAKGARAGAGEAGEEDDEVDLIGVARSFGDFKVKGLAGGVAGVVAQGEGEVFGIGRLVREDCIRRGGSEDLAGVAASDLLGGDEGWEDGEEGKGGGEIGMHGGRCESTGDVVMRMAGRATSLPSNTDGESREE